MFTVILTAIGALLLGVALTLWVEWKICSRPIKRKDDDDEELCRKPVPLELPKELLAELERIASRSPANEGNDNQSTNIKDDESLLAINLLVQFFFRQLRSEGHVRRFLLDRINLEMEEVLTRGSISKIIKGLKIYDVEMGSRAPSIHRIQVNSVGLDDDKLQMESMDLNLDIEYSGGLGIAIDVALAYGKSAFLSVKVIHLKGQVRLRFSRLPFSHWSVTFCSPPQLEVDVTSRVQGRSFSHVTSLVSSQIHKWIQRKYTLPASRVRHRPFFPLPEHSLLPPPAKVTSAIRKGSLEVTVLELSRLNPLMQGDSVFCTMALDSTSWLNVYPSESEGRVVMDVRLACKRHQSNGIHFHSAASSSETTPQEENKELKELRAGVQILDTEPGSPAEEAGLRAGDIILQVDDATVQSTDDVLKSIQKSKESFVILRVERFIRKRKNSMARFETLSRSPTLDGLDDKSVLVAALEDQFSTSLLLPLVSNSGDSMKPNLVHGIDIKRTPTYPWDKFKSSGAIYMRETLKFQVSSNHRFLNLSVVMSGVSSPEENGNGSKGHQQQTSPSKTAVAKSNLSNLFKKHSSSPRHQQQHQQQQLSEAGGKDARDTGHKEMPSKGIRSIGHVNIRLPEVVADCQLNTQGHHISTYQLFPSDLTASLGQQHVLSKQLGFDPRLCYGDIVLSFVYRPDKMDESPCPSPELDSDELNVSLSAPTSINTSQVGIQPDQVRPSVNIVVSDSNDRPQHDFVITQLHLNSVRLCEFCRKKIWLREALQCRSCGSVCHKKCIKRFPERKWCSTDAFIIPTEIAKEAVEENPFIIVAQDDRSDELVELAELEAAVGRLQTKEVREHNESFIQLAKDSGKGLYGHLSISDRRAKISSMLQRLEAATEVEMIRHYELSSKLEKADGAPWSTSERNRMEKEVAECENRRQALVLLLLFYSAGLRSAEEAEDHQQLRPDCCD